jgi:DNA-binding MarR family transcriptional regulator
MSMASQLKEIEAPRSTPSYRLGTQQIAYLLELGRLAEPTPVTCVGRALGITDRAVPSRIAVALAKVGLVERTRATNGDLRVTRVQLTEAGRIACEKLSKIYRYR